MISFRRLYHISSTTYSIKKQGLKLCKMINPTSKKQWRPSQSFGHYLPTVKDLTKTKFEPSKRAIRRKAMLNKMFMKHVTDIMSTGTVSMNIVGQGIEISKVNVSPDFKTLNVYWICKGTASDKEIEDLLCKIAGPLRHELSTVGVVGEVPLIVFLKDMQEARLADLDRRLAIADYGEDYVLTEEGHLLKSEFVLNTKISPEVKAKIRQLEEDLPIEEDPIPEMTHSVYGLDHDKILKRLLAAKKKSSDAWLNLNEKNNIISYRGPSSDTPQPSVANQKKELAEFLLQRQILHKKIARGMRNKRDDQQIEMSSTDTTYDDSEEGYYDDIDDLDEYDDDDFTNDFGYDSSNETEQAENPTNYSDRK